MVKTLVSRKADARFCEEALGVKFDELAVESNAAFLLVSDPLEQRFVKARGDSRARSFH